MSEEEKEQVAKPILSYGIILFTITQSDQDEGNEFFQSISDLPVRVVPKYLIYQRRDNYEYIDILRGNWSTEDRFRELSKALSVDERERLLSYTFRELWDDLWIVHGSRIHTEGYERAKKRYEQIKPVLHSILSDTNRQGSDPPWGFPKGKKLNPKEYSKEEATEEEDTECALREFSEETRMPVDEILLWDTLPFVETYRGNNDRMYSTHYYLAEAPCILDVNKIETPGCIRTIALSEESADAMWVTFEEACTKINPRRQNILKKINMIIEQKYYSLSPFAR
jgi:8-oxo-dGTP pyrophosphatase MutT (NUDIX family)